MESWPVARQQVANRTGSPELVSDRGQANGRRGAAVGDLPAVVGQLTADGIDRT